MLSVARDEDGLWLTVVFAVVVIIGSLRTTALNNGESPSATQSEEIHISLTALENV